MRGDGRIFQRGAWKWIAYCYDGREHREPAKTRNGENTNDLQEAEKFLRAKIKKVHAAEVGTLPFVTPKMNKTTVRELLEHLKADFVSRGKASPQNLSGIKRADEAFGDLRATALTAEHINEYIEARQAEDYAPASINRITGFVEQAFALAVREEKIPKVPYIKRLSEQDNVRQGFCGKEEFLRVHANLPEDLKDFCLFAFSTGWRRGEIARLDWSNVQDNDSMIRLRPDQAKNGHGRSVPVEDDLVGIIERRRAARRIDVNGTAQLSHIVFHRGDGFEVGDFRKTWAKATKAAGLPGLLFHDLRRAAVTAMINAGVPQLVAMSLSGHRTSSMFFRYGIKVEDEQRSAMAATAAYHKKKIAQAEQKRAVISISGQ